MPEQPVPSRSPLRSAAFVATALLPVLLGAGDDTFEANRQRIEAMTATDRAALQYKFNLYKSLSDADRQKYEVLHRALDEDARQSGNLRQVMGRYQQWLKTLDPFQRAELRKAADVNERMQLVRRYLEEQQTKPKGTSSGGSPIPLPPAIARIIQGGGLRVAPQDIEPPLALLADRLDIAPAKRLELQELPAHKRHAMVLATAIDQSEKRDPQSRWPSELLARDLIESLPDPEVRRKMGTLPNNDARRDMLRFYLMRGVAAEWQVELEKRRPTEAQLLQFSSTLDQKLRDELAGMPKEDAERALLWQYFSRNPGEHGDDLQQFRRLIQKVFPRDGLRGGPDRRFGPEGRGPDGEGNDGPPPRPNGQRPPPRGDGPPGEHPRPDRNAPPPNR